MSFRFSPCPSGAPRARVRDPEAARDAIISSGKIVFNREGYFGTNSNIIAERSGYAASPFYTHFRDKLDLFLVVYSTWVEGEWSAVQLQTGIHVLQVFVHQSEEAEPDKLREVCIDRASKHAV